MEGLLPAAAPFELGFEPAADFINPQDLLDEPWAHCSSDLLLAAHTAAAQPDDGGVTDAAAPAAGTLPQLAGGGGGGGGGGLVAAVPHLPALFTGDAVAGAPGVGGLVMVQPAFLACCCGGFGGLCACASMPAAWVQQQGQLAAMQLPAAAGGSSSSSSDGLVAAARCAACVQLAGECQVLHEQLQQQVEARGGGSRQERQALADRMASVLVRAATGCQAPGRPGDRPFCLASLQLPDAAEDAWFLTLLKARYGRQGRKRGRRGTQLPRQQSFHANSPAPLSADISGGLWQQLAPNSASTGSERQLYGIRSRTGHVVACALAALSDASAAALSEQLWVPHAITCRKKDNVLYGRKMDGFIWSFVSVGSSS